MTWVCINIIVKNRILFSDTLENVNNNNSATHKDTNNMIIENLDNDESTTTG